MSCGLSISILAANSPAALAFLEIFERLLFVALIQCE